MFNYIAFSHQRTPMTSSKRTRENPFCRLCAAWLRALSSLLREPLDLTRASAMPRPTPGLCDRSDRVGWLVYAVLASECPCCTFWRGVALGAVITVCLGALLAAMI